MLSTVLVLSLVAGLGAAQNSTALDPNSVPLTQRNQWCSGETNNCPTLCGGPTFTKENTCTGATLDYKCTCTNGTAPLGIEQYLDTLPNHICQETFKQCNINTPGSSACQTCGTLMPSSVPSSTTSAAAAATSSGAATTSAAGAEATPSPSGAAGMGRGEMGGRMAVWSGVVGAAGVLFGALLL